MSSEKLKEMKRVKKGKIKEKTVARSGEAKANLRELIFTEARSLVLEEGFASLSIRKLAERIGYAPGTIYLYFRDRDELVREICVRGLGELSQKIQSAADVADAQTRLTALLYAYADFAVENPETYRLTFMENPAFTQEAMRAAPLESEGGAGKRAFAEIVKTLRELKGERKIDPAENEHLLAEMLWTAVHGMVSLKLVYPAFPVNPIEVLIDKLIETILAKVV